MYWQTKEHEKYVEGTKIPRIRAGTSVPAGAVNLAYAYAPLPSVSKNIKIVDIDEPGTGNIDNLNPIIMWPDKTSTLCNLAGKNIIPGQDILITDIFKDGIPLFYKHRLKYYIYSQKPPDNAGFYTGSSIQLINKYDFPLSTKWLVKILPVSNKRNLYYADVYLETEEKVYVRYDAIDLRIDNTKATYTGYKELCKQTRIFEQMSIDEVMSASPWDRVYCRTNGDEFNTSRVYVPNEIIKEVRKPQQFHYSIRLEVQVNAETKVFFTPSYYAEVLNKKSLLPGELTEYNRNDKIITSRAAKDLINPYVPSAYRDLESAIYTYTAICDNPEVRVKTRPDGLGPLYATTTQDTGKVNITGEYNTFVEDKEQECSFIVELVYNDLVYRQRSFTINIKKSLGQIEVTNFKNIFGFLNLTETELNTCSVNVKYLANPDKTIPMVDMFVADSGGRLIFGDNGNIHFSYQTINNNIILYAVSRANYHYYASTYAVKSIDCQRIKLLPPLEEGPFESWYVRIQRGMFKRTIFDIDENRNTYVYFLPEYERQPYSGFGKPYAKVDHERPIIEDKYTIKVKKIPILINELAPVVIKINDKSVGIIDIDPERGIIELESIIMETDQVEAFYYYKETCLTYKGFTDEHNNYWFLDLNPGVGHTCSIVGVDNKYKTIETFKLLNKTIYIYLNPAGRLDENDQLIPGSYNPNSLLHSFEPLNVPTATLIGMISIRPHLTSKGLSIVDTRTRGGGIKPELIDKALEIEPASEYYWDIGRLDGQPYMESGIGVIRVPKQVLKKYGGKLSEENVETVVHKYIAWGTLPIIEYVDRQEIILEKPTHPNIILSDELTGVVKPLHVTVNDNERIIISSIVIEKPSHLNIDNINVSKTVTLPGHPNIEIVNNF